MAGTDVKHAQADALKTTSMQAGGGTRGRRGEMAAALRRYLLAGRYAHRQQVTDDDEQEPGQMDKPPPLPD